MNQSSKRLHNLHNLFVPHLKVLWKLKLRIGCYSCCWFLKHFSTSWKGLRRVGGGGGGGIGELIDHPQKKLKMHAQDTFFLQQEAWQSFFLLFENKNNNNNVLIWSDLMGTSPPPPPPPPPPPAMITHRQSNGFFFWTLISVRLNSMMCRFVWGNCPTSKSFQGIQLLNRHTNWNLGKTKKTDRQKSFKNKRQSLAMQQISGGRRKAMALFFIMGDSPVEIEVEKDL